MDNYELDNNETIYPILQIELEGKKYLFYSNKESNISDNNIFVGEELEDELLPVSEEMLEILEEKFRQIRDNSK